MKHVLSALIIVSLLGVRTSAADEPRVVDGLTTLQSLGEIRLETITAEGIEEAYSELKDLVAELVEFLRPDADAVRVLSELHVTAEERARFWAGRCRTTSASQDCDRAMDWERRLRSVLEQIEIVQRLKSEGTFVMRELLNDKNDAVIRARMGDGSSATAAFQDSLSLVQEFVARFERVQH